MKLQKIGDKWETLWETLSTFDYFFMHSMKLIKRSKPLLVGILEQQSEISNKISSPIRSAEVAIAH